MEFFGTTDGFILLFSYGILKLSDTAGFVVLVASEKVGPCIAASQLTAEIQPFFQKRFFYSRDPTMTNLTIFEKFDNFRQI